MLHMASEDLHDKSSYAHVCGVGGLSRMARLFAQHLTTTPIACTESTAVGDRRDLNRALVHRCAKHCRRQCTASRPVGARKMLPRSPHFTLRIYLSGTTRKHDSKLPVQFFFNPTWGLRSIARITQSHKILRPVV